MKTQQVKGMMVVQVINDRLIKAINFIKNSFYFIATVFLAVAFLLHIYLPNAEPEVTEANTIKIAAGKNVDTYKDSIVDLAHSYNTGEVVASLFREKEHYYNQKVKEFSEQYEAYNQEYQQARNDAKITGFPSRHKFWWHFGIGLVLSWCAFDALLSIRRHKGYEKNKVRFGAITKSCIAGYYMTWIFFPWDDLPRTVYLHTLLTIGILAGICAYYLVKHRETNYDKLKKIKELIFDFVIAFRLDYRKLLVHALDRNEDHKRNVMDILGTDTYDDAYEEVLKKGTEETEERMRDTVKKVDDWVN